MLQALDFRHRPQSPPYPTPSAPRAKTTERPRAAHETPTAVPPTPAPKNPPRPRTRTKNPTHSQPTHNQPHIPGHRDQKAPAD